MGLDSINSFTIASLKSYFKMALLLGLLIMFINSYLFGSAMSQMIKNTVHDIHNIIKYEGLDHNLVCVGSDCTYIKYNNIKYQSKDNILTRIDSIPMQSIWTIKSSYFIDNTEYKTTFDLIDGCTLIQFPANSMDYEIRSNIHNFYERLVWNSAVVMILFFLLFTYGFIRYSKDKYKTEILETFKNNAKLENKYQKVMSESAHHEMMQPVAAIKTFSEELHKIYALAFSEKGCDARCTQTGKSCNMKGTKQCANLSENPYINESNNYFSKIEESVQQLEAVLGQMRDTKHFKYSNGDKTIFQLIDNISSTMKVFNIDKFEADYINQELMERYSVYDMSNGEFLNVVSNHITNSIEAKSHQIVFQSRTLNKNKRLIDGMKEEAAFMEIFIIDNGVGIRNEFKDIISKEEQINIFKAGVSTKDKDGNHIVIKERRKKTLFNKLKRKIIDTYTHNKESDVSFRGVGLYVNKTQLQQYNGDLTLEETSEKGTVFKITIPIKITRKATKKPI